MANNEQRIFNGINFLFHPTTARSYRKHPHPQHRAITHQNGADDETGRFEGSPVEGGGMAPDDISVNRRQRKSVSPRNRHPKHKAPCAGSGRAARCICKRAAAGSPPRRSGNSGRRSSNRQQDSERIRNLSAVCSYKGETKGRRFMRRNESWASPPIGAFRCGSITMHR